MRDIKVITARAILPIQQVVPVRGFSPVSVLAMGDFLDKTSEVFYNGTQVDQYLIQSVNRLLIRVPDSQLGRPLTSIVVYSNVPTASSDASLAFGVQSPLKTASGIDRMVQSFLMVLMTTPGSDIFSKSSGGGLRSLVGRSNVSKASNVSSDIALAVERTKSEILREQAKFPSMPLDERLLSAALDTVSFDKESSTLFAKIALQNMLGQSAEVNLG